MCRDNCIYCDISTSECGSCRRGFWGPTCERFCDDRCGCCDLRTGACTKCIVDDSAISVSDSDEPSLDYISIIISAGLCVGVITIAAAVLFVVVRICRSRQRNFIKQSLDDDKIVVCKDDVVPVSSQENEDAYTQDPATNQQAQKESYYMNVKVANEMNDQSVVNNQPDEDSLNTRGVNSIPDVPDINSEVALYTNSLEIREHMQTSMHETERRTEDQDDTLRARGSEEPKENKYVAEERVNYQEHQGGPLKCLESTRSTKNSQGSISSPQLYTNFEKHSEVSPGDQNEPLRCRGRNDPNTDFQVKAKVPDVYTNLGSQTTNFESQEMSNGYLTSISANKLRTGVPEQTGTKIQESSEVQDKLDAGAYIYVDSKSPQPNSLASLISRIPEHGTYTNVLTPEMNREASSLEPQGWYEELKFTRPTHTYHEINSGE